MGDAMAMATGQPVRVQSDRIFFTAMALASALAVFLGFAPTYFLRVATLPPLTPLYHVHGALFMTWIVLFVAQTALVAGRRTDLHRSLGVAGAVGEEDDRAFAHRAIIPQDGVRPSAAPLRRTGLRTGPN